ncbi:MAG: ribosome-associated translation inhibitor RaiA [Clostridia bacterium]|nr:ribosome-associated translation inhibitor RaiA [Clostridia bacterium]
MRITVSGKNINVRESLKEYIEGKMSKFDKYFTTDIDVKVTLSVEKDRHKVEITMPLKQGVTFRAEETSDDMYSSVDMVMDKLTKQMRKHKTKIEKRYHKHESIRASQIPDYEGDFDEKKIVRTKSFPIKPMDPEEAVLQMEMLNHDFYVFMNGETEEVNVVYIRKDGNYGLIEPTL